MSTPNFRDHQSRRSSKSPDNGDGKGATPSSKKLASVTWDSVTPRRFIAMMTPSAIRSASRRISRGTGLGAPSTPFGIRAMQRRAANTPGRDRRKSGRMQRETPFDILRNLGKALAPVSQSIRSSPQEKPGEPSDDELDNEPVPERPRLSLPIEEETEEIEEGSSDIPPPRLSLAFDEEDLTQRSVEYPRRAQTRVSFGDVRLSENFGDLSRLDGISEGVENTTMLQQEDEGLEDTTITQGAFDAGGETEDLRRFNLEFDFPTPDAPRPTEPELVHTNEDGFMLNVGDMQLDTGFPSSDGGPMGGIELDIHIPDRVSDVGTPGLIGGGIRDEPVVPRNRKEQKISRHGIRVPNLPSGVVRKVAMRFARTEAGSKAKINKDTLAAIEQASAWFFEQVSEDLSTYSKHAGRKTIDESDVIALMRRQRHLKNSTTIFSLAQKHLPKELLQDIRLAMTP